MSERDDALRLARTLIDQPPPAGKMAKFYIDHVLDYEQAQTKLAEAEDCGESTKGEACEECRACLRVRGDAALLAKATAEAKLAEAVAALDRTHRGWEEAEAAKSAAEAREKALRKELRTTRLCGSAVDPCWCHDTERLYGHTAKCARRRALVAEKERA